jgi:hypothetical protein
VEGFERLPQKEAVRMAETFANRMTEALAKENSQYPVERKPYLKLEALRQVLIPMYVTFLSEQYIIVPE